MICFMLYYLAFGYSFAMNSSKASKPDRFSIAVLVLVNHVMLRIGSHISDILDLFQATLTPSTSTLGAPAFPPAEFNHRSGFWLYMGHGGTTARAVNSVPPRPIHSVRWMSL